MKGRYSGGCACRAVRYYIFDEPIAMNDCQCRDCQHMSGTGHGSYLTFPNRAQVKLEGQARHFEMTADNGNVKTRSFCANCGSPVYMTFSDMPELFTVHAGSLDDPSRYEPECVTFHSAGHAWDVVAPSLRRYAKMPTSHPVEEMPLDLQLLAARGSSHR